MIARPLSTRVRVAIVVGAILALPLVVGLVRSLIAGPHNPGGDVALIELRVRDIGHDTPRVGSYTRFGAVNHPGPLWFYALWLPYRLFGSTYTGLQVGVLVTAIASVIVIATVAFRRGGLRLLLWTAVCMALLMHALGSEWLADPWEPRALILPCAALLFVTFDAMQGSLIALPIATLIGCLLAQAQATLLPFAVTMVVVALTVPIVDAAREPAPRLRLRRTLVVAGGSGALALALWMPPLAQQVTGHPGNLSAFVDATQRSDEPKLGVAAAWRAVAFQLKAPAQWTGADFSSESFGGRVHTEIAPLIPIGAVLLLMAAGVGLARRHRGPVHLVAAVAVAVVAAVAALSRLIGPLYVWIPYWTQTLGMAAAVAVGWTAHTVLSRTSLKRADAAILAVLALALAVTSLVNVGDSLSERQDTRMIDSIDELAGRAVPSLDGPTLVRSTASLGSLFGDGTGEGLPELVYSLSRKGVDVVVDRDLANHYGSKRARPERARSELRLIKEGDEVPLDFRVVATLDPLRRAERAERNRILDRIPALDTPGAEAYLKVQRLKNDPKLAPLIERYAELPSLPPMQLILRPI